MLNIMEQLETLDSRGWNNLFSRMEEKERECLSCRSGNLQYRYLDEIDDPEGMLYDFATMEDIRRCGGKTNWFICSDGTFYTCGDYTADLLFESGKVVEYHFPFEIERKEKYNRLSKEERISFRTNLQGITEIQAKEIVCNELGISAYKNIYVFSVDETFVDSFDNSEENKTYTISIKADTENEAREKFAFESREVGSVVSSGRRFTKEDNQKMRESGKVFGYKGGTPYTIIVKSRNITLVDTKENQEYLD